MDTLKELELLRGQIAAFEDLNGSLDVPPTVTVDRGSSTDRGVSQRWVKWSWPSYVHSPIYYSDFWIQVWENGVWKHGCHIENRSGHSDWDVWVDLYVKNWDTGSIAFGLKNAAWTQDLDHGENWNKTAQGFSRDAYDLFAKLYDGTLQGAFTSWKARDN